MRQVAFKSKLPELPTSIFTTMSQMAKTEKALNLSQGFPDFPPDPKLLECVHDAMRKDYHQYAPLGGIFPLREQIAEKIERCYGASYHPQKEITVTVGATQAIFTAISAFVYPGDEVIVLKPAYDCYEPTIIANGGIPVLVQMKGKEHKVDWEEVASCITSKTRMIIINTPHNPSGRVFSKEEMLKLENLLRDTDIIVVSDEVYEHLVFDGRQHESASKFPDLASRSLVCASFGKTFHITGWKMGYCASPEYLMAEFQKIHEFAVFCVNHPLQHALTAYLKNPDHYLGLGKFFEEKRNLFLKGIEDSRFAFVRTMGTYFQLLDYSQISMEPDMQMAERLTKEFGIASIPISVFNKGQVDNRQLRFCFAKKEETLNRAIEILQKI
ncbi:methionine aminotransferase [Lentiprolixibacter aurantiacus]|uniref:Methionine aminotransferase n=1 Tax=Lentiprolixibacter aurantiacus TaxID=2993939 RepID=A0AAE3MIW2_9FLAO|nr:methionine aminotransferase [Lentiprolixibacter aurantiacus]MCX2718615.1 methionine aminotransferase [Lentiprolixibacter aurantiacus]